MAAALIPLAIAAVASATAEGVNIQGQNTAAKASEKALQQEQGIQQGYNKKIAGIDAEDMTQQSPGAQQQSIGGTAANLSKSLTTGTANPTAAAAQAAAGSQGGTSSGQISQATTGAQSGANLGASVISNLFGTNRQMQLNRQGINDWEVQRNRQKQFGQSQASNVFPWMLQAAQAKGAGYATAGSLIQTLGAAAASAAGGAGAGAGSSSIGPDTTAGSDTGIAYNSSLPFSGGP